MVCSISEMADEVFDCIETIMEYTSRTYDNFVLWIAEKINKKTTCSEEQTKLLQNAQVMETIKVHDEPLVNEPILSPAQVKG